MKKLVDFTNGLTDMDKIWWPILFLRPEKDKKMSNSLVGILSVYYGLSVSISLFFLLKLLDVPAGILTLVVLSIVFIIGVFIGYRVIFAYSWNTRAEKLQAEH